MLNNTVSIEEFQIGSGLHADHAKVSRGFINLNIFIFILLIFLKGNDKTVIFYKDKFRSFNGVMSGNLFRS